MFLRRQVFGAIRLRRGRKIKCSKRSVGRSCI